MDGCKGSSSNEGVVWSGTGLFQSYLTPGTLNVVYANAGTANVRKMGFNAGNANKIYKDNGTIKPLSLICKYYIKY